MDPALDRFSHHPELRDRITDPLTSPSRSLTTAKLATLVKMRGLPADWWYASSGMCVSSSGTHSLAKGTRVSLTNHRRWRIGYGLCRMVSWRDHREDARCPRTRRPQCAGL